MHINYLFTGFLFLTTLSACVIDVDLNNIPPVAVAGQDQNTDIDQLVQLDGSASMDKDGDTLSYHWTFAEKPIDSNSNLRNANSINPTFSPDLHGKYILALTVNDGQVDSDSDTLIVTSGDIDQMNIAPIADAGSDLNLTLNLNINQVVQLDGTASSDANGDNLSYLWTMMDAPSNSAVSLSSTTEMNPTFTPDMDGAYVLRLVVSDDQLDSDPSLITIMVTLTGTLGNVSPIANAGPDQNVITNQSVQFNGAASSDANGDDLVYLWSIKTKPNGSNNSLTGLTTTNPTFTPDADGTYVLQLMVHDGLLGSTDTITITSTAANIAPVANAGFDRNITTSQVVQLDASASSDANNDPLTYRWSFTAQPVESSATLDNTSISGPVFVPDVDGTYRLSLIVNDSELDSVSDTVTITSSSNTVSDDFSGSGPLIGYTTNNPDSLPDVARVDGRYRANLVNNRRNITLHYNSLQGRLDAKLVTFPFEYIARNIGIGTQEDSQQSPPSTGDQYIFAGIQVHVPDLESRYSSHMVVGHRGSKPFTIEGKNTFNGQSSVRDIGVGVAPDGRADLRIVGNADRTLTAYWQLPNLSGKKNNDEWTLYRGTGELANPNKAPAFGDSVYIGLITYAQGGQGVPYVGTCDAIEFTP